MEIKDIFTLPLAISIITTWLTSCSGVESPQNLEPEIIIYEASEITRTEATLSAEIILHGTTPLSYVRFYYGENDTDEIKTAETENPSGTASVRLTDLKPGHSYSFFAEAGALTASFKSETLSFTTFPNDLPTVAGTSISESGPTAIMVSFLITSDGGEPIIEAGCELTDLEAGTTTVYLLEETQLREGRCNALISGLAPLAEYRLTPFATNSVGTGKGGPIVFTTDDAIRLSDAGRLENIVGNNGFNSESITISGKMNGDDFSLLRRLLKAPTLPGESELESSLSAVNLSNVVISEGGGTYDGSHFTSPGIVTTGLFSNCSSLTALALPMTATAIERNALESCTALRSIVIPSGVADILPSAGCTSLQTIEVSAANGYFKSIDGVLLNADATQILWFPMGKSDEYQLPASITKIGENAFDKTNISAILLHGNLTEIGRAAFASSLIESIDIPDKVTNIYEATFQGCPRLVSVKIGKGIVYIGDYVFDDCPLKDLFIETAFPPYLTDKCFPQDASIFSTCTLHVPSGSRNTYRAHRIFGKFENITED